MVSLKARVDTDTAVGLLHEEAASDNGVDAAVEGNIYLVAHGEGVVIFIKQSDGDHHTGIVAVDHHVVETHAGLLVAELRKGGAEVHTGGRVDGLVGEHVIGIGHEAGVVEDDAVVGELDFRLVILLRVFGVGVLGLGIFGVGLISSVDTVDASGFTLQELLEVGGHKGKLGHGSLHGDGDGGCLCIVDHGIHLYLCGTSEGITIVGVTAVCLIQVDTVEAGGMVVHIVAGAGRHKVCPHHQLIVTLGQAHLLGLVIEIGDDGLGEDKLVGNGLTDVAGLVYRVGIDDVAHVIFTQYTTLDAGAGLTTGNGALGTDTGAAGEVVVLLVPVGVKLKLQQQGNGLFFMGPLVNIATCHRDYHRDDKN